MIASDVLIEDDLNKIINHKKVVSLKSYGEVVVTVNPHYKPVPMLNLNKIHNERKGSNPYYVGRDMEEKKSSWCTIL